MGTQAIYTRMIRVAFQHLDPLAGQPFTEPAAGCPVHSWRGRNAAFLMGHDGRLGPALFNLTRYKVKSQNYGLVIAGNAIVLAYS